jgi:uncharacterized protein (DUF2147 family)
MKHRIYTYSLLCTALLLASPCKAFAFTPSGYWQTEDKQTVIEFKPCAEALCGYLAFTGVEAGAKDEKNPDPAQRNRTLCNLLLVTGLKKDGEHYSGGAFYDPETGASYNVKLSNKENGIAMRVYEGSPMLGETLLLKSIGKNEFTACDS